MIWPRNAFAVISSLKCNIINTIFHIAAAWIFRQKEVEQFESY